MTAVAVWLGWQIVKAPVLDRAPASVAIRLAPSSPEVLRRAAEAELLAEREDNAVALAEDSLSRAPFNARALRVRGLAEDDPMAADQILTLAGNWSLRDDPTHAWLVERRLQQGSYGSSFAHADTLVRRRRDLYPQIFNLFTTAAVADPRAIPALAGLLAIQPPWRDDYLASLYKRPEGPQVLLSLALALEQTSGRFRGYELERLYSTWAAEGRVAAIRYLRSRINRPPHRLGLQNGDFTTPQSDQILPFGWRLGTGPGLSIEVLEDDVRSGEMALRLDYDGYGSAMPLQQMMTLSSGPHVFSGEQRFELQPDSARLAWTISCVAGGDRLLEIRPSIPERASPDRWAGFSRRFTVPENCTAQWLRLEPRPGDFRSQGVLWLDKLSVTRASPGEKD